MWLSERLTLEVIKTEVQSFRVIVYPAEASCSVRGKHWEVFAQPACWDNVFREESLIICPHKTFRGTKRHLQWRRTECADRRWLDRRLNLGRRGCGQVRVSRGGSESSDRVELKQLKCVFINIEVSKLKGRSHLWMGIRGEGHSRRGKVGTFRVAHRMASQVLSLLLVHMPRYLGSAVWGDLRAAVAG